MSERLSFSYPKEMKEELQRLAKADCRSLSSYVQTIINDHIKSKMTRKKKRPVKRK